MGRGYGLGGYGMMGGGSFLIILIIVALGFFIYFYMKKKPHGNEKDASSISLKKKNSNALEIAKERLAKGEISLEEFEEIKKKL